MSTTFGTGPTLREANPWLSDDAQRHARILQVVEINSVIEGLPPFSPATRERIAADLAAMAAGQMPGPLESCPVADSSC
jgi:hypothetical protein